MTNSCGWDKERTEYDFVVRHVVEAIRGGVAALHADKELARRLNAETKLRLITMSDEELWKLAELFSPPLGKSVESSFQDLKRLIDQYRATARQWSSDLRREPRADDS
jgi:hypothetical protein